jgi:hypothetical protein
MEATNSLTCSGFEGHTRQLGGGSDIYLIGNFIGSPLLNLKGSKTSFDLVNEVFISVSIFELSFFSIRR